MKDIFEKNSIKSAVEEIQKIVSQEKIYTILFPGYNRELKIGKSVVGQKECQRHIAKMLKGLGIKSTKVAPRLYIFYLPSIKAQEKKDTISEAVMIARWLDLLDD